MVFYTSVRTNSEALQGSAAPVTQSNVVADVAQPQVNVVSCVAEDSSPCVCV